MSVRLNPYLVLNGNAKAAVDFYQKALQAELVMLQTFGDMPSDPNHPTPPEMKDRVMHALLKVGETDLMFSDTMPGMEHKEGDNVTIAVVSDTVDQTKAFYEGLKQDGQVQMELQATFWSPAYAIVKDKFGITFQLTTTPAQA